MKRGAAATLLLVLGMSSLVTSAGAKPVLTYGTFLGSSGHSDNVSASTVDAEGYLYVVGSVDGDGFPVTAGAYQPELLGGADAFVARFDPAGQLVFATYFGGNHHDSAAGIALGPDGTIYVSGATLSADLPVTPGAFQTQWHGNVENCEFACSGDGYVARFSADGTELLYSTFLGGELSELAESILVDDQGRIYVAGFTTSPDFPATTGAFDEVYNAPTCFDQCDADAFVARLNPAGTSLDFSTFYGGTSWDSVAGLDVDAAGNIYIGGGTRSTDLATTSGALQPEKMGNGDFDFSGFVAAFSPDASQQIYGTYLGKRGEDHVTDLSVLDDGRAWVTGFGGRGLPVTGDALQPRVGLGDAFAIALEPDGGSAVYGTYIGGEREDYGRGIEVTDQGDVLVAGSTGSQTLETRRAAQPRSGGREDLFFLRFRPGASRPKTLTYLGGEHFETSTGLALGPGGTVYLTGTSESPGMPLAGRFVQNHQMHSDAIVMRLQGSGLVRAQVRGRTIRPTRLSLPLTRATLRWRNATDVARRFVETAVHLFVSGRRVPGSDYYFSFPAGRFVVARPGSDAVQRVAVAPTAVSTAGTTVDVRWARVPLPVNFVFDVKVAVDGGPYELWQDATHDMAGTFAGPEGSRAFKARVRNLTTGESSAWSPPALVSTGG